MWGLDKVAVALIEAFAAQGPIGLAILVCFAAMMFCLVMGWFFHQYKTSHLTQQLDDVRNDRNNMFELVRATQQSIDKNTSAIENNTITMHSCIELIHRVLEGFHKEK